MAESKDKSWLEQAEDYVSDDYDRQRSTISEYDYQGKALHDVKVGAMKGVYHGVKGLISGAIDLAIWTFKMQSDPETQRKADQFIFSAAKELYISKFGSPEEVQDQNRRIINWGDKAYEGIKKSVKEQWAEAEKTPGKRTELVTKWVSRGVFEVALFFIGAGEAKGAATGAEIVGEAAKLEKLGETARILDEVTQPCKTLAAAEEEVALLAKAKAADAAKAAKAAEATDAAKAAEAAEAARKSAAAKAAEKVGMKTEHVEALVKDCAKRDRLAVYRKSNPKSLKYHGKKGYRAKPHEVEVLKTAKEGEHAGLVVRPKNPNAKELAEIRKLEDAGWTFDEEGRLLDPDKNMIHGDYDMQGVYKEVGTDAQGKPIYEKVDTNSESSYFLEDQNEMITPERDMHQHGANDNYTKTGPNGEKVMGRTPGADETYLVVDKNGTQVIESTAELQKVYEANNIPWPY